MILDANAWLGHWPFADLEPDSACELCSRQASRGISLSCVASIDAVFYTDPMPGNRRLLRELRQHATLEPVPILNPSLPTWPDALTFYVERYRCRQIRLVPNYHGYALDAPFVDALVDDAAALGAQVSIQMRLEDERAHHPLMQVPGVPADELERLAQRRPQQRFLALCCYLGEVRRLAACSNLMFDISYVEYLDTLNHVLGTVPAERLLFGTHSPFLVNDAALAKLRVSSAPAEVKAAVAGGNLSAWLGGERSEVPWAEAGTRGQ